MYTTLEIIYDSLTPFNIIRCLLSLPTYSINQSINFMKYNRLRIHLQFFPAFSLAIHNSVSIIRDYYYNPFPLPAKYFTNKKEDKRSRINYGPARLKTKDNEKKTMPKILEPTASLALCRPDLLSQYCLARGILRARGIDPSGTPAMPLAR